MSRMQIVVVAITIALNALDGFDVLSISFASPGIRAEFGINQAVLGIVLSAELFGMAFGSIFLGRLADSWGRRPMMLSCLVVMSLGMFMVTTDPGILGQSLNSMLTSIGVLQDTPTGLVHVCIWRVITGLGIGGMLASINAVVAEYSNAKNKHMNVALMSIGYPVGASVGGFIAAWLLIDNSWHSVFYLGFAMTVILIPIVYFLVPETVAWNCRHQGPNALERINATLKKMGHAAISALPDMKSGEHTKKSTANIFSSGLIAITLIVTAAYFFHITTFYFILKWTPDILVELGFQASEAGNVLSWVNVGGATGGALLGFLTLKFNLKRLTIGAMVMSSVMVVIYGRAPADLSTITLICIGAGFFTNAAINGMYAIFAHAYPTHVRAAGTGFAIGVGRGGSLLAPILAGFLFNGGMGVPTVATIMAGGSLLAALALSFLKLREEPPEAVEAVEDGSPGVATNAATAA
jgi:MFS family permease